jgi:hypothetical protein
LWAAVVPVGAKTEEIRFGGGGDKGSKILQMMP